MIADIGGDMKSLDDRPIVIACRDSRPSATLTRRRGSLTFDLEALRDMLLAPFAAGEGFRRRGFDHLADAEVTAEVEDAPNDADLVLDRPTRERYVRGQELYFADVEPTE